MVALPERTYPTLEAMDAAMEEQARPSKGSLSCGTVGEECWRRLWYQKRWVRVEYFNAETLRKFEDGHLQESVAAERLRKIPGIELWTEDETGEQFRCEFLGGHVIGYVDGVIRGIREAPKTVHIWEHKSVAQKQFNKLKKLLDTIDEKEVLKEWNLKYYAQGILYMEAFDITRHFMTVSTPGGRDYLSLRTNASKKTAKAYLKKAESIIFSDTAPARISNNPDSWQCRFCNYQEICQKNSESSFDASKNCRTCAYITPKPHGAWACENLNISEEEREASSMDPEAGCGRHLFNPSIFNERKWRSKVEPKGGRFRVIYTEEGASDSDKMRRKACRENSEGSGLCKRL